MSKRTISVRYISTKTRGLNAHLSLMNLHFMQAPCGETIGVCHQLEKLWKPYWLLNLLYLAFRNIWRYVNPYTVLALGSCLRASMRASYIFSTTNFPLPNGRYLWSLVKFYNHALLRKNINMWLFPFPMEPPCMTLPINASIIHLV